MRFNEALKNRMMEDNRKIFDRPWKIILFNADGFVLGESKSFKMKKGKAPSFNIVIIRTGTVAYAMMTEGDLKTIRDYTYLIGKMHKQGKTVDQILEKINQEKDKYEITFNVGECGAELNLANTHLLAGNSLTIDTIEMNDYRF